MTGYRHTRQTRLEEVGEEGQARLARARVEVRGRGVAGLVETRYLAGAGVGSLDVEDATHEHAARAIDATVRVSVAQTSRGEGAAEDAPFAESSLDPIAYEVAIGAWRALDSLRSVLGVAVSAGRAGRAGRGQS